MVASSETNVIQHVLVVSYQSGEPVDNCFVLALSQQSLRYNIEDQSPSRVVNVF